MDLPVRKRLSHAIPHWVSEGSWYFLTINCERRNENQLCQENVGPQVLLAMAENHQRSHWHCRFCLLMPDHLHAIIAFPPQPGMKTVVSNWKRFLGRKLGVPWQRDFFDHRLRDHHELYEKESYIMMNPVRKGLCERAEDWPWVFRPPA